MPFPSWWPISAADGCSRDACLDRCNTYCNESRCPAKWTSLSELPFSSAQYSLLKWITVGSGLLSALSSGFILLSFRLLPPTQRQPALRIVFWLSVADLLSSLTYVVDGILPTAILGADECSNAGCELLAAAAQFFGLAAVLWSGFVALNLYFFAIVSLRLPLQQPGRYLDFLHAAAWTPAALSVAVLFWTDALGPAGLWCWIKPSASWARFAFYEVPVVLSTAGSACLYFIIGRRIKFVRSLGGHGSADGTQQVASALPALRRRLRAFALIFALVHGFRIADRWREDIWQLPPSPVLAVLHALFGPLQGLGNVLIYGWSPRIRRAYAHAFPKLSERFAPAAHCDARELAQARRAIIVNPIDGVASSNDGGDAERGDICSEVGERGGICSGERGGIGSEPGTDTGTEVGGESEGRLREAGSAPGGAAAAQDDADGLQGWRVAAAIEAACEPPVEPVAAGERVVCGEAEGREQGGGEQHGEGAEEAPSRAEADEADQTAADVSAAPEPRRESSVGVCVRLSHGVLEQSPLGCETERSSVPPRSYQLD